MTEKSKVAWAPLENVEVVPPRRRGKKWTMLRPFLTTVLLGVVMLALLVLGRSYLRSLLAFLARLPLWQGVLLFQFLFIIVSLPFTSGYLLLNITAGYLYGFKGGLLLSALCAGIGVPISLVVCRQWFLETVQESLEESHLNALSRIMDGSHGFRIVCLARLTPIPFGLQNACLAVTNFPVWRCCLASIVGLLPAQLFNSHLGSTVRSMEEIYMHQWDSYLIVVFQFIVLCSTLAYVAYLAQQELTSVQKTAGGTVAAAPSPPIKNPMALDKEIHASPAKDRVARHTRTWSHPNPIQFV